MGDIEWARQQLNHVKISQEHRWMVEKLLEQYWAEEARIKFPPENAKAVFEIAAELAQGHNLAPEQETKVWAEARPGWLVVRDEVRVKHNAYTGPAGPSHNGREGVIVAIRYGDIHVRYEDGTIARHSPHALEKRIG